MHVAPEPSSEPAERDPNAPPPSVEAARAQRLLPLIAAGLVTMSIGFGFAIQDGKKRSAAAKLPEFAPVVTTPPNNLSPLAQPTELTYLLDERTQRHQYRMFQTSARASGASTFDPVTVILETTVERTQQPQGEGLRWTHQHTEGSVAMAQGEVVGPNITQQLSGLIAKAAAHMDVTARGRVEEVAWTSSTNPQTLATFSLVADAIVTLTPRLRAGRLMQGDTWTYELALPGGAPTRGVEVEGALQVHNTLLGTTTVDARTLIVIEQKLKLRGKGKHAAKEGSPSALFEIEGSGEGVVLFDREAGAVHRHGVALEQTMTVESGAEKATQERKIAMETQRL